MKLFKFCIPIRICRSSIFFTRDYIILLWKL